MANEKDAIRSAPLEPRRDAAPYGDEAGVATRDPQDANPGSGSKVGGASTDAQIRYEVVLGCGHGHRLQTVTPKPPTTAAVAKCDECGRHVPVVLAVRRER